MTPYEQLMSSLQQVGTNLAQLSAEERNNILQEINSLASRLQQFDRNHSTDNIESPTAREDNSSINPYSKEKEKILFDALSKGKQTLTKGDLEEFYCIKTGIPVVAVLVDELMQQISSSELTREQFSELMEMTSSTLQPNFVRLQTEKKMLTVERLLLTKDRLQRKLLENVKIQYTFEHWTEDNLDFALRFLSPTQTHKVNFEDLFEMSPLMLHRNDGIEKLIDLLCLHRFQVTSVSSSPEAAL